MVADHLQFLHGECKEIVSKEKLEGVFIINIFCEYLNSPPYEDSKLLGAYCTKGVIGCIEADFVMTMLF